MSQSTSTSSILQVLECSICQEIMRNPKTLKCEHSFCKDCIEECVKFNTFNVPFIPCPTCRIETSLGNEGTVSGLKAQLTLKQILDGVEDYKERCHEYDQCCNEAEGKLSPRCCALSIEWYCWNCKSYFCKKCFNLHSLLSSCGIEFYEVQYSEIYNAFTFFCSKHDAFHRYGCLRCTSTFCSYCQNEHIAKGEDCKIVSFKEYGSKFKDPLMHKISLMETYKEKQESLLDEINKSSSNIQTQNTDIKKYIEDRKIVVLSQVLFLLQLTGKQILNNFNEELKEYEITKQKLKDEIDSKLNSVQEVLDKSQTLSKNSLVEVISQTKELQDEFHSVLPEDVLQEETEFPELQLKMEAGNGMDESMDNLFLAIQAVFGDLQVCTMTNDGSYESTMRDLNTNSNNIDCSSSMISKLNTTSESRKYVLRVLKQMGLLTNLETKSASVSKESEGSVGSASAIKQCHIKVCKDDDSAFIQAQVPSLPDGTLLLSKLRTEFPNATGLKYKDSSGTWQDIQLKDGALYPPPNGWNDDYYYLNTDKIDTETDVIRIVCHAHPLRLSQRKKWNCQICGEDYRSTKSYFCGQCKYDACNGCVVLIGTVEEECESLPINVQNSSSVPAVSEPEELPTSECPSKPQYRAFLGNLPSDVKPANIKRLFHGLKFSNIHLPKDKDTGESKRFGFVEFPDIDQLNSAVALSGKKIGSSQIRIMVARPANKDSITEVEKEVDDSSTDGSEDSVNLMEGADEQSSSQKRKSAKSRRKRAPRKSQKGKSSSLKVNESQEKSGKVSGNDQESWRVRKSENEQVPAAGYNAMPLMFERCSIGEMEGDSSNDNDSTTSGDGNTALRGGRGARFRGRGNRSRGGHVRMRGNSRGCNNVQPNNRRGGVRQRGGRGILNPPGAHQRPAPASSLPNLAICCYRCGESGHLVSNCPQARTG